MEDFLISTAYLPPIEFFYNVRNSENLIIEKHENYQKQTYRNRCRIYTANGILPLSIPVIKSDGNHTLIKNIKISYVSNWQLNHWRAIESAYNKSPFFLYYRDDFERILMKRNDFLIDLNSELLEFIFKKIGFFKKISFSESFQLNKNEYIDLRNRFFPKKNQNFQFPHYYQVFEEKHGFISDLSIIDLLFNKGPESGEYLRNIKI